MLLYYSISGISSISGWSTHSKRVRSGPLPFNAEIAGTLRPFCFWSRRFKGGKCLLHSPLHLCCSFDLSNLADIKFFFWERKDLWTLRPSNVGHRKFCYKQRKSDVSFSITSKKIIIANIHYHLAIKNVTQIKEIPHHRNLFYQEKQMWNKVLTQFDVDICLTSTRDEWTLSQSPSYLLLMGSHCSARRT